MLDGTYPGDFAIVAEGYTDQVVLEAILMGFFEDRDDLAVNFEQPPSDQTGLASGHAYGGWGLVLKYFKAKKFRQALQMNQFLVVHIDTDVAGEFGLPRREGGVELTHHQHIAKIIAHFREMVDDKALHERIVFAIAVESIECWLLPLVIDKSQAAKIKKTTGCLRLLNHALASKDDPRLSSGKNDDKDPRAYRSVAKGLAKKRSLLRAAINPGFQEFLRQLASLASSGT
jgi:hypothetical protein